MKIQKLRSRGGYVSNNYVDVFTTGLMTITSRVINISIFGIIIIRTDFKNGRKI
jgi:hypothetical protein